MAPKKLLVKGNSKLDKTIFCFAITPVASCKNCSQCKKDCYALSPYRRWTNVRNAWDRNFEAAKDGSFVDLINGQLKRSHKCQAVRIHVAGDFFSNDYIKNWNEIVTSNPTIQFYSYSKVFKIFNQELVALGNQPNCNIINSITADGGVNFGNYTRVSELKKQGYSVCPVSKNNNLICGKHCKICLTENKVCFNIH